MELNAGQRAAVYTRNKDLLVSASAGSGKTHSLCLRILEELCDEEHPYSLDRLLIVTFTRAAAGEMRERLFKGLKERYRVEKKPEARKILKRQMSLLPAAKICTIDSYCLELVRKNYDKCGLSPAVRVADDAELYKRKLRLMKRSVEKMYASDTSGVFARLCDGMLSSYNDKDLPAKLVKLYEKTENLFHGIETFLSAAKKMEMSADLPFSQSFYGKKVTDQVKADLTFFKEEYRRILPLFEEEHLSEKQLSILRKELDYFENALSLVDRPVEMTALLEGYEKEKFISKGLNDLEEVKWFKQVRAVATDYIRSRKAMHLGYDLSLYRESCRESAAMNRMLYTLFSDYSEELKELKSRMGVLEFSDVEHYALDLLYDGEEISAFAKKLSSEFDEIYIDEYQDVNELQDKLFLALSRRNRFAVGDVKQSIYGFRGACPSIFSALRERYPDYIEQETSEGRIFLTENYRSVPAVIRFVNAVCAPLMNLCTDMTYLPEDDLVAHKSDGELLLPAICLVKTSNDREENEEAEYLARNVAEMIKRGRDGSEIGILVRSMTEAPDIRRAFENRGLILDINCKKGFFETPEVLLLRCLLEMINDPTADIYLAGGMKSPVFGFTLSELAEIRQKGQGESLFAAVCDYAETTGDLRCRRVLHFIAEYRTALQECTADKLVWKVMSECMLLPLLSFGKTVGEGQTVKENLLFFYDLCRTYAGTSTGELSKLLEKIADMAERDIASDGKSAQVIKGHVRLMTIHGSKGLEFPVCWLYGCSNALKLSSSDKMLFDEEIGFAPILADGEKAGVRRRSAVHAAAELADRERAVNEELRILYVALTRARDELYISGTFSKSGRERIDGIACCPQVRRTLLEQFPNYLNYILAALNGKDALYRLYDEVDIFEEQREAEEKKEEMLVEYDEEEYEKCRVEIEKRLSFRYPHTCETELPTKLSVSKLFPQVLDEEEKSFEMFSAQPVGKKGKMPAFYKADSLADVKKNAAARGSATHAFMQFCDFVKVEEDGVITEAKRLIAQRFLSPAVAELIEYSKVEAFFESALYKRMKDAKTIYREQRFTIELPASDFTEDAEKKVALQNEKLLIQGVIDCFFIDEQEKLVLFDYKTDHFQREQLADPANCADLLRERHKTQLGYYKRAVEMMMGRPVDEVFIYSFALSSEILLSF